MNPGRDPAELNAERTAARESPELMQTRIRQAAVVVALTELRTPARSLADAYRAAVGRPELDAETAGRLGLNLRKWAARRLSPSLAAVLLAGGFSAERLVDLVTEQAEAVRRRRDGSVLKDPETGEPVPDLAARARAVPMVRDLLSVAGLLVKFEAPTAAELAELEHQADHVAELEHTNGHAANGHAAAGA